jgi:hypothetical protein
VLEGEVEQLQQQGLGDMQECRQEEECQQQQQEGVPSQGPHQLQMQGKREGLWREKHLGVGVSPRASLP